MSIGASAIGQLPIASEGQSASTSQLPQAAPAKRVTVAAPDIVQTPEPR